MLSSLRCKRECINRREKRKKKRAEGSCGWSLKSSDGCGEVISGAEEGSIRGRTVLVSCCEFDHEFGRGAALRGGAQNDVSFDALEILFLERELLVPALKFRRAPDPEWELCFDARAHWTETELRGRYHRCGEPIYGVDGVLERFGQGFSSPVTHLLFRVIVEDAGFWGVRGASVDGAMGPVVFTEFNVRGESRERCEIAAAPHDDAVRTAQETRLPIKLSIPVFEPAPIFHQRNEDDSLEIELVQDLERLCAPRCFLGRSISWRRSREKQRMRP